MGKAYGLGELRRDIKDKSLAGVYLFTGEEKYLISAYEKSFIKIFKDGTSDISVFEGKNALPDSIADTADTPSFMGGRRLVVVKGSGLFTAKRKGDSEKIAQYINECYADGAATRDGTLTVILFIEDDIDKRGRVYKAVNKQGRVVVFDPLREREMVTWIIDRFRKNGTTVSSRAASYLVRICGGSMEAIAIEIEKLCAYKMIGDAIADQITEKDMDDICAKSSEARIFDLIDAVAAKDRCRAISIYNELLSLKEQPIGILAMLGRQFTLVLKSGLLAGKGHGEREIAEILKQHPYSVKIAVSQSRKIPVYSLKGAVLDCAKLDTDIKTGGIEGKLGVELLILKYTA